MKKKDSFFSFLNFTSPKKFDFVVLGATGMQGRIVSRDLLKNGYSVLLCGRDKPRVSKIMEKYKKETAFEHIEMTDIESVAEIIKNSGADVVVNCVEGDWNLNALKACLKAKANCLDLGSEIEMTEEQLAFDEKLKKQNLISLTGCGSVPGVGNIMLNYASEKFDAINEVKVGFAWNSNLKKFIVPFSIQSIIEEFTDPAPIVKNSKFIKKVPLETIIEKSFTEIGRQKCFFVRHPETFTFFKYFKDKGLKNIKFYAGFPDHSFEKIISLIDFGLGSKEEILFKGIKIKPVEFLTEVLKRIEIPKNYKEKENLWVEINGMKNGSSKKILMECLVPTLKGWEDAGCNIDTGMPASIMAQMIKKNIIKEKGSFSPERAVPPLPFFKELKKRKMIVLENGKKIN
jgi:saccharopine dehydrogenase (NAD+, L-lysine-forming)